MLTNLFSVSNGCSRVIMIVDIPALFDIKMVLMGVVCVITEVVEDI